MTKSFAGKGLSALDHDEHRVQRKILNNAFTPQNIRRLEPVFQSKAGEVGLLFDRAIEAGKGGTGVIDCTDTFGKAMSEYSLLGIEALERWL
jgi:cytochrome P450